MPDEFDETAKLVLEMKKRKAPHTAGLFFSMRVCFQYFTEKPFVIKILQVGPCRIKNLQNNFTR